MSAETGIIDNEVKDWHPVFPHFGQFNLSHLKSLANRRIISQLYIHPSSVEGQQYTLSPDQNNFDSTKRVAHFFAHKTTARTGLGEIYDYLQISCIRLTGNERRVVRLTYDETEDPTQFQVTSVEFSSKKSSDETLIPILSDEQEGYNFTVYDVSNLTEATTQIGAKNAMLKEGQGVVLEEAPKRPFARVETDLTDLLMRIEMDGTIEEVRFPQRISFSQMTAVLIQ